MLLAKTYPCQEHDEVSVPITELLVEGKVEVFPEVTGRGFFDIDFRRGQLVLIAKSYVGLIPINPRVSIHVMPRMPIDNVLYLVQKAKKAVQYLPGYDRNYRIERLPSGRSEELFAASLLECLIDVERNGLIHRYVSYETNYGWRGRVLLSHTVSRHRSKGILFRQAHQLTELSVDIPENQIIKDTLMHIARYFSQFPEKESKKSARRAATLLQMFDRVSNVSGQRLALARQCLHGIKRLPGDHRAYEPILWLCYLIVTRQGVSIESFGPARIQSMVVNLADIFESYVRQVIRESLETVLSGSTLKDGNRHQVRLFTQGGNQVVKPDIYIEKAGVSPIVLDAKYKPALRSADRYEVLAFCEALQSKLAIFISPKDTGQPGSSFLGRTRGGIDMHEIRIDLSATDILAEEKCFLTRIRSVLPITEVMAS